MTLKSKHDQEIPQSHTADKPTVPCGRALEHLQSQDTRKTINIKERALSLFPIEMIEMIAKLDGHKVLKNTEPSQTLGATINNESTTTEPPLIKGQQPSAGVGAKIHFTGTKPSP